MKGCKSFTGQGCGKEKGLIATGLNDHSYDTIIAQTSKNNVVYKVHIN